MNQIILTNKLQVPESQGLIHRPLLVSQLDQASLQPLTVIQGAAGYGKTSLVCDWLDHCPVDCCWLSLDSKNDVPSSFWLHVCASLSSLDAEVAGDTENILRNLYVEDYGLVCDTLIASLNKLTRKYNRPSRCVLVLDDFHEITQPQILTSFSRFLDYKPYWLQVILTTRTLPKLGMPQRLSKQKAVLIDSKNLAFSEQETHDLLVQKLGETISSLDKKHVYERSGGWPAAIQLMALALESGVNLNPNIKLGDNSLLSDFLFEEVYLQLEKEIKQHLRILSVVERFSASLAECLTGSNSIDALLQGLMNSGLFITKIVDQNEVHYKIHDLFRVWLMNHTQQHQPDLIKTSQQKAMGWLTEHEYFEDALYLALTTEDWAQAALMMRHIFQGFLQNGNLDHIQMLLDKFPINEVIQRPHLSLLQSLLFFCQYQHDQTQIYLDYSKVSLEQLEQSLEQGDSDSWLRFGLVDQNDINLIYSGLNIVESLMARFNGDEVTLEKCLVHINEHVDDNHPLACWSLYGNFVDEFIRDEIALSLHTGKKALLKAKESGDAMCTISVLSWYLHALFHHGQVKYALKLAEEHVLWIQQTGLQSLPNISSFYCGLCHLYIETFQFDKAWKYYTLLENTIHKYTEPREVLFTKYYLKYKLLLAVDQHDTANQWLDEIKQYEQTYLGYSNQHRPFSVIPRIEIFEYLFQLSQGNAMPLIQWSMMPLEEQASTIMKYEVEHFIQLVGITLTGQDTETEIDEAMETAQQRGTHSRWMSIWLFKALVLWRAGENTQLIDELTRLIPTLKSFGYQQLVLDGGRDVPSLLRLAIRHDIEAPYCELLLSGKGNVTEQSYIPSSKKLEPTNQPSEDLLVTLTVREKEVLEQLSRGIRNQQISEELGISLATVKRHIQNIYGKLQVNTRTEAALVYNRSTLLPS